jgi:hypothetical protein
VISRQRRYKWHPRQDMQGAVAVTDLVSNEGFMMRNRVTIIAGSLIVAGSIVLAVVLQSPRVNCSYPAGAPSPCPTEDLIGWRIGIVAAGFVIALLILIGGRIWSHRRGQ